MKKHTLLSDLAVFLLILFLFIVPPFFSNFTGFSSPDFSVWSFPWYQLLLALFSSALLFFYYERIKKNNGYQLLLFPVLFTFGILFSISLFCRFLAEITKSYDSKFIVTKPASFLQWFFCLLNFLCAAFYEEVLYRFYFIDELKALLERKKQMKWIFWLCEFTGLLCFAIAHLYMGWISVLNAALAHIVLRLCYKKSGKLWPCVTAHFIYNVISLILL